MKAHSLQCSCGKLQGHVDISGRFNHVICYCKDCQAYAKFLENKNSIMDTHGGTEIIQIPPSKVKFTKGLEQIAVVRLTDEGMMRWYAKCCNTPIGNTSYNYKQSLIGLIHNCLESQAIDPSFGVIHSQLNTKSALGGNLSKDTGVFKVIIRFLVIVITSRLSGKYKDTPFFNKFGQPIVEPTVLNSSKKNRYNRHKCHSKPHQSHGRQC